MTSEKSSAAYDHQVHSLHRRPAELGQLLRVCPGCGRLRYVSGFAVCSSCQEREATVARLRSSGGRYHERVRRAAVDLVRMGWSHSRVAAELDVRKSAIGEWVRAARESGHDR